MADEEKKAAEAAKEEPKKAEAPKKAAKDDAKEGEEGAEGAAPQGLFADKKKLLMFGGGGAALLLIIAGIAVWWFVLRTPAMPESGSAPAAARAQAAGGDHGGGGAAGPSLYYDVPEFSLNLASSGQQEHFLRLKVTLELASAAEQQQAEANAARLQDDFLQYLRQLRLDDLRGNAGLQRMKEDLLLRASQTLAPVRVRNVLFREVLVQ